MYGECVYCEGVCCEGVCVVRVCVVSSVKKESDVLSGRTVCDKCTLS